MRRALAVALALLCGACTIGRDYVGTALRADPDAVLHPGRTKLPEVLQTFGAPEKIQHLSRGDVLTYRFVRKNTSELDIQDPVVTGITVFVYTKHQLKADRLTLFFDQNDTLIGFGHTRGVEELDAL